METKTYRFETELFVDLYTIPITEITDFWLDWTPFDSGPGIFNLDESLALGIRAQGFTDDLMQQLVEELIDVPGLRYLHLAENRNVTNRGVGFLRLLPQVRYLNISSCDVNSEGLQFLPSLENLEMLDISYCNRISGAAGKYVQQLPRLKTLMVQGTTKLNTADLKKFEKRGLEIKTMK